LLVSKQLAPPWQNERWSQTVRWLWVAGDAGHEYVLSLMSHPPDGKGSMHCEDIGVHPRSIKGWQSFVSVLPAQV
jgi:hypothetical protein